ncbi:PH domain protein [Talaromyces pinophilus]|uniref:PH domain protein n=1 Tax=Talaromyces pinophilus TaxID=128442 RepID=A0A6V8GZ97_TALPI|nr:PH domain protein [Talaromyces pinophilus]
MAQSLSVGPSSQTAVNSETSPIDVPPSKIGPMSVAGPSQSSASFRTGHLNLDTFSPVNEYGSFEFDRVLKRGKVFGKIKSRHAFKASWKPCYLVLRPNLLSVYKDEDEARLLLSITLSDVAAVAPIHSARSHREHVWGIFSPSQNYRFQSISEQDAKGWMDRIRAEVHIDEEEEAIVAQSKSTKHTAVPAGYTSEGEEHAGIIASEYSDIGETDHTILSSSPELMRTLSLGHRGKSLPFAQDYSGNEMTEYSDLSDGPGGSSRPSQPQKIPKREDSGDQQAKRPSLAREPTASGALGDPDRVICHGWLQCLHSKRGVRQWKKLWVVLRPVSLALYKDEREYCAIRIIPMSQVINAAEIDPISRSKNFCLQIITEDRPIYRFCAPDEESLAKWLGALKSIVVGRKKAMESRKVSTSSQTGTVPSTTASAVPAPTIIATPEPFQPLR